MEGSEEQTSVEGLFTDERSDAAARGRRRGHPCPGYGGDRKNWVTDANGLSYLKIKRGLQRSNEQRRGRLRVSQGDREILVRLGRTFFAGRVDPRRILPARDAPTARRKCADRHRYSGGGMRRNYPAGWVRRDAVNRELRNKLRLQDRGRCAGGTDANASAGRGKITSGWVVLPMHVV